MFAKHQSKIAAYAKQSPDNLAEVIKLAIFSANTPLYTVGGILDAHNNAEQATTSARHNAASLVELMKEEIYWHVYDIEYHAKSWREASEDLTYYYASLFGLGIVKGGFAAQLAHGVSGCLDTHNLRIYGIPARTFDNFCQRKTVKGRRKLIRKYIDTIAQAGGSETPTATAKLWDNWCEYVTTRNPKYYPTGEYVSKMHCDILGIS